MRRTFALMDQRPDAVRASSATPSFFNVPIPCNARRYALSRTIGVTVRLTDSVRQADQPGGVNAFSNSRAL